MHFNESLSPLRLPFATYPKPDELLSSWVTRLAYDHLIKAHTFGKLLFPGLSLWNRDLDKLAPEELLTTLAARTPASLDRIRETTLRSFEGRLYLQHNTHGNTNWLLPLGIYHRRHRLCGLLFCPKCLQKDGLTPYFRKHWRLAFALTCVDCGVYLQQQCPECSQPITFFRVELGRKSSLADQPISRCYQCGFDLSQASCIEAPSLLIAQQTEWYRILREGWREEVAFPHLYFDVLRQLTRMLSSTNPRCRPLQLAVQDATRHIWPDCEINIQVPTRLQLEHLPFGDRNRLLQQSAWLLTEWPKRFISLARSYKMTSTPFFQDMRQIPYWYYTVVYDNLYVSNVNRRFDSYYHSAM